MAELNQNSARRRWPRLSSGCAKPAALALVLAAMAGTPARADDRQLCEGTGQPAIAACTRAIDSGAFSGADLAKLHTNRGVERKGRGDLDGAIADYTEAIRLNPTDAFAFNNRANAVRDKGALNAAIADYTEALRLDPGYTAVYVNRGLVFERMNDIERARTDYTSAVERPPKYRNGPGGQQIARERLRALSAR